MPYFDAASAEPLHPSAREALLAALDDGWADPARLHREGRRARLLLVELAEGVKLMQFGGCDCGRCATTRWRTRNCTLPSKGGSRTLQFRLMYSSSLWSSAFPDQRESSVRHTGTSVPGVTLTISEREQVGPAKFFLLGFFASRPPSM